MGSKRAALTGDRTKWIKASVAAFVLCYCLLLGLQAQSEWLEKAANTDNVHSKSSLLPSEGEYPDQDDVPTEGESQGVISEDESRLLEKERAHETGNGDTAGDETIGVPVPELGGLIIQNGEEYMNAPYMEVPPAPADKSVYKQLWPLQRMHDKYFTTYPHRRSIPRLGQRISRKQFHEVFRKRSIPVIIPFQYIRHLGFATQGHTLQELREMFPFEPTESKQSAIKRKEFHVNGAWGIKGKDKSIPWERAIWKLEQEAPVLMNGPNLSLRNIPRNMKLQNQQLAEWNVSYPPFLRKKDFQPPTMWFGTSSSDTVSFQIMGTKRWYIAPPSDTPKLLPVHCSGKNKGLCWSSLLMPMRDVLPRLRPIRDSLESIEIAVKAGEMLYLFISKGENLIFISQLNLIFASQLNLISTSQLNLISTSQVNLISTS
ncbi:JmjC domain-containing protein 8 [Hondaea fermentalgiana]|uniref:JmjC domain-containing protein 8 n=1 Tax=Hondaea fermentalgiana TaxID=2315210 RepID=A0A2R5G407_9STRA|nr:JmjC domain-containing protein 8 [Hondaea fermentalgiana]|eukprot:GBG25762.1 JmjC domain-containing protein 8 [Hondaea fermentalgiana]